MGERPAAMQGGALFFGGNVAATVTISRGIGRGVSPGGKKGGGGKASTPNINNMEQDDAIAYLRARQALGSPMPPVTVRLKLANLSQDTVTVDILELNSDLGNFAVEPELLAMAPQQIAEPDPMISQLGVTADSIPVKVTLRLAGKTETQVIAVKSLAPPAAPPLR
jgi:hypothetical protein